METLKLPINKTVVTVFKQSIEVLINNCKSYGIDSVYITADNEDAVWVYNGCRDDFELSYHTEYGFWNWHTISQNAKTSGNTKSEIIPLGMIEQPEREEINSPQTAIRYFRIEELEALLKASEKPKICPPKEDERVTAARKRLISLLSEDQQWMTNWIAPSIEKDDFSGDTILWRCFHPDHTCFLITSDLVEAIESFKKPKFAYKG